MKEAGYSTERMDKGDKFFTHTHCDTGVNNSLSSLSVYVCVFLRYCESREGEREREAELEERKRERERERERRTLAYGLPLALGSEYDFHESSRDRENARIEWLG